MYVPEDRRKFFVTVREVEPDGTLGKSQSFSICDSETRLSRTEVVQMFKNLINSTDKRNEVKKDV